MMTNTKTEMLSQDNRNAQQKYLETTECCTTAHLYIYRIHNTMPRMRINAFRQHLFILISIINTVLCLKFADC